MSHVPPYNPIQRPGKDEQSGGQQSLNAQHMGAQQGRYAQPAAPYQGQNHAQSEPAFQGQNAGVTDPMSQYRASVDPNYPVGYQPGSAVGSAPGVAPTTTDTLGILAVIAAFAIGPVGLILGIVGWKQATHEGRSTTLSRVATFVGAFCTLVGLLFMIGFFVIMGAANSYSSV